eukprot:9578685-Ditylum_brightwellii.AAC.1
MKLERNGKGSSGKKTRHINIRYFFVTDRIGSGELTINYCLTELMVADFYTKPLQGKLDTAFLKYQKDSAPAPKQDTGAQECVGQSGNKKGKIKSQEDDTRLTEHVSTTVAWNSTAHHFPATYFIWRHLASHFNRMATTGVAHN